MTIKPPTERDYRAFLAFLWTALTFTVVLYAMHLGWGVQQIITISAPFMNLCAVFIYAYFEGRKFKAALQRQKM